jgi:Domain of unknown function (DUF4926)
MTNVPLLQAPVALVVDVPEHGLTRGEMGTVVARLAAGSEKAVLVEFADDEGQTYALIDLKLEQLVLFHRRLCAA